MVNLKDYEVYSFSAGKHVGLGDYKTGKMHFYAFYKEKGHMRCTIHGLCYGDEKSEQMEKVVRENEEISKTFISSLMERRQKLENFNRDLSAQYTIPTGHTKTGTYRLTSLLTAMINDIIEILNDYTCDEIESQFENLTISCKYVCVCIIHGLCFGEEGEKMEKAVRENEEISKMFISSLMERRQKLEDFNRDLSAQYTIPTGHTKTGTYRLTSLLTAMINEIIEIINDYTNDEIESQFKNLTRLLF